jgi:tetratricopeptide (TPR) repeat protein
LATDRPSSGEATSIREHYLDQAVTLNQQILSLDPQNAAVSVRLARAYQAQRKFADVKAAFQEALRLNPGSAVAKRRLQRIAEESACATQAQAATSFEDALRRGVEQKDQGYAGLAIAYLWRAVELSVRHVRLTTIWKQVGTGGRANKL